MSDPTQTEKRLSWLSFVFDSAIKHGVFRPADVIVHASPEVLARDLPKELQVRVFEVAFEAGKLTPEGILGVTPPSTLVKHIAPSILWEVVRDAAARHGIVSAGTPLKTGKTPVRNWIAEVIAGGLERDIYSPSDVTRHIPPGEWVKDVPLEVVAKLIAAGLTRPAFDPRLALDHLTPVVIGEFIAPHLSWGVIDEGAVRGFELQARATTGSSSSSSRPSLSLPKTPVVTAPAVSAPPPTPAVSTESAIAALGEAVAMAAEPAPAAEWDANSDSVDAWVDSSDMVEAVVETPSSGN